MGDEVGRVLVVDDSQDDHLQIRRLLKAEFTVVQAHTGADALDRIAREPFDALITDQKMPRMSGSDLIAAVRDPARGGRLPAILLSGRTGAEQLVSILRAGQVFRYFEKDYALLSPEGQAEFLQAVRNAVQAGRLERERGHLNQRLQAQVDALDGQYRLLRALVDVGDPTQVLRLVVDSLAQRVRCLGVLGLVDLHIGQPPVAHLATRSGARVSGADAGAWVGWAVAQYGELSGRTVQAPQTSGLDGLPEADLRAVPTTDAPLLPVFINRDLRGVLCLVPEDGTPLESDEGELLRVWREQLQDALTRVHTRILDERRRVQLMVESMTEGVILTDEEGSVTLMNPTARRILELPEAERADFSVVVAALGLSSLDVVRQLGVGDSQVAWRDVQRGKAFHQVLFSQVRDHAGAVIGILTVIRDVTRDKLAEQRREDFVHIIGHELRSPLTSIGGILDLLSKQVLGELSGRQRDYVEMAKDSCVRINHILNDLLDLAKFEEGKMPLTLESADLSRVVRETVRKFEAVAIEKSVTLDFDCLLEGLFLEADGYRLAQVVNNLLSNALKFTPGGGTVSVAVFTTFTAPNLYLVSVHNTGDEIPESDLDRIFDKFEQVQLQGRRSAGGTGLGLSICRNIVEGHSGEIWVESGQGEGTRFTFALPCAGEPARRTEAGPAGEAPILAVGTDFQELLALKAVLLGLGHRVRLATGDPVALAERVAATTPSLVIHLDADGDAAAEVLGVLAQHSELPVLGLVPPGTPRAPGVDVVLELPAEPAVLSSVINVLRARREQRRRQRALLVGPKVAELAPVLESAGYLAYPADSVSEATRRLAALLPDVLLLDASLSGAAALGRGADGGPAVPRVLIGAGSAQRDEALADAVVVDEVSDKDLLLLLRSLLGREARTGLDALAVLPGAREVQREVQARMTAEEPFAFGAVDLLGLDTAIAHHGFMWGHATMVQTAEVVHAVLAEVGQPRAFLGHQREDDFVFLVSPERCNRVCEEITRAFARIEPLLAPDTEGGPGLTVQVTAVLDPGGRFTRYPLLVAAVNRARERTHRPQIVIDRPA